jgi:hypothetical protein
MAHLLSCSCKMKALQAGDLAALSDKSPFCSLALKTVTLKTARHLEEQYLLTPEKLPHTKHLFVCAVLILFGNSVFITETEQDLEQNLRVCGLSRLVSLMRFPQFSQVTVVYLVSLLIRFPDPPTPLHFLEQNFAFFVLVPHTKQLFI